MTDRLRRERALPEDYQFGDARGPEPSLEGATLLIDGVLHTLHAPAAVEPPTTVTVPIPTHWNVIEGDHCEYFGSDADRPPVIEGAR